MAGPGKSRSFLDQARSVGVIPVVTIERVAHAVPLARALAAGGLPLIEITLRTRSALDAIKVIAEEVKDVVVGAGTVLDPAQGAAAVAAGARFVVSPGATDRLVDAAQEWGVPYLPGVATASEAMRLAERGLTFLKLFPAEAVGGMALLKSLAAPLPEIMFCPTGGIDASKAAAYRALPNVACVGGSWMAPHAAMEAGDWGRIRELAESARDGA
ncbi:MAG: keto-deoxy-phosphogluconate aldolase [Rhizobiales bacterium 65-9]|nr:bifunctional 4-hydroxy-2-oxoglutarate aldolase/2-dehydro-3-deoxy-phosphogluconate aldolase [Hyphomicrobiales bacterium]OJY34069.1 MAG: keto-deoxy-phosphogluconate aldolase [Rhizobiales bacterium 65-9]